MRIRILSKYNKYISFINFTKSVSFFSEHLKASPKEVFQKEYFDIRT